MYTYQDIVNLATMANPGVHLNLDCLRGFDRDEFSADYAEAAWYVTRITRDSNQ